MKRYVLRRPLDRFTKGADITAHYAADELERWAKDGLVTIEKTPDPVTEPVEDVPDRVTASVEVDPIVETPVEDVPTEPAAPAAKRKRK